MLVLQTNASLSNTSCPKSSKDDSPYLNKITALYQDAIIAASNKFPQDFISTTNAPDETVTSNDPDDRQTSVTTHTVRVTKRQDAIVWDDYFMSVAFLSAMRSKDPSTQVGACIVNNDHRIVGIGYNGFPAGQIGVAVFSWRPCPSQRHQLLLITANSLSSVVFCCQTLF